MKTTLQTTLTLLLALSSFACTTTPQKPTYAIVIHGGAGSFSSANSPEKAAIIKSDLAHALQIGQAILAKGGSSLDAVEQVIRYLEDNPRFNAGKGAVLTAAGTCELDASIMDGKTLACGASGGTKTTQNPISLARRVMTQTRHVLLMGDGADAFAKTQSLTQVPNSYFITPSKKQSWERIHKRKRAKQNSDAEPIATAATYSPTHNIFGTVGCAALDQNGNLAAGTSTGGLMYKMAGRIGDSPIIAAGTYADNKTCAVSCTGVGEEFIRNAIAFRLSALMQYKKLSLQQAADHIFKHNLKPNHGGIIAVSHTGQIVTKFNTRAMARAAANSNGFKEIHIFPNPPAD